MPAGKISPLPIRGEFPAAGGLGLLDAHHLLLFGGERVRGIGVVGVGLHFVEHEPGEPGDPRNDHAEADSAEPTAAWPAAKRAVSTRYGEQLT